jgi:hypothetical protein
MTTKFLHTAVFAVFLGISAAQPFADASAAASTAQNQVATMPSQEDSTGPYNPTGPQPGSTGIYDNLDQYKDSTRHPLQGYGYLFAVPGA